MVRNKIKKGNTIFSKCTRWQIGSNFFSWNYGMTSCVLLVLWKTSLKVLYIDEEKLLVKDVISNGVWNGTSTASLLSLLSLSKLINSSRPFPSGHVSTTDDSITWESSPSGDFDPKNVYHLPLVLLLNSGPQRYGVFISFVHPHATTTTATTIVLSFC